MREIKFRGKKFCQDEWIYGSLITRGERGADGNFIDTGRGECYPLQQDTIGQFTGLHDKNGNEIYEGDFVRYHMHERGIHESEYQTGIVEFGGGCFYADLECSTLYFCGDSEDYEVIGNKWDNPEL